MRSRSLREGPAPQKIKNSPNQPHQVHPGSNISGVYMGAGGCWVMSKMYMGTEMPGSD